MSKKIILCKITETYSEALAKMQRNGIHHFSIASEKQFIGMISIRDVLQIGIENKNEKSELLNDYVYYTPDWQKYK